MILVESTKDGWVLGATSKFKPTLKKEIDQLKSIRGWLESKGIIVEPQDGENAILIDKVRTP